MWVGLTLRSNGGSADDTEEPDRRHQETLHLSARRDRALPASRAARQNTRPKKLRASHWQDCIVLQPFFLGPGPGKIARRRCEARVTVMLCAMVTLWPRSPRSQGPPMQRRTG